MEKKTSFWSLLSLWYCWGLGVFYDKPDADGCMNASLIQMPYYPFYLEIQPTETSVKEAEMTTHAVETETQSPESVSSTEQGLDPE